MDKLKTVLWIENYSPENMGLPPGVFQDARDGTVELWNAARPLHGNEHYVGDFMRGRHYAVIPLAYGDEYTDAIADGDRKANRRLDAFPVEFVTVAQIEAYRAEKAAEYDIDLDEFEYKDLVLSYVNDRRCNG